MDEKSLSSSYRYSKSNLKKKLNHLNSDLKLLNYDKSLLNL